MTSQSVYVYWQHIHNGRQQNRFAAIVEERRTRMTVLINAPGGTLKMLVVPLSERQYMTVIDMGARQIRKANASLRKAAKQPGTSAQIRNAVTKTVNQVTVPPSS